MWRTYSADYMKNNRAFALSVMAASFIAALFLSFLGSLFYNFWLDNIEGVKLRDGDWHGRITANLGEEDLAVVRSFANVKNVVVRDAVPGEERSAADIYFHNKKTIYRDMTAILNRLGLSDDAADYNYQLLSLYFIRIPGDTMPRMLMPAYLVIVVLVCVSLVLVIHNSFAVSMNNRVRQFGIFSSIGATPGQILICLVQEALVLALVPIFAGMFAGVLLSYGTVQAMSAFAVNLAGGRKGAFHCHPAVLALLFLVSVLTVFVSAWIPAAKLSRLTPLEAIRGTGEFWLKKQRRFSVLSVLFGVEGELAGNALRAQKRALRTTSLSLTLAFLGFMMMQCFFTLSTISTNHTYFEAYQDVWDVMVTVKDTAVGEFDLTEELRNLTGIDSLAVYQKAQALCILPKEKQSEELLALGGLEAFVGDVSTGNNGLGSECFVVNAPIVVLDDESFSGFCRQIGIVPRLDGTILLNRFWDSKNSNFRYRKYISFVKDDIKTVTLQSMSYGESDTAFFAEIPVLACTKEAPLLREEYEDYALVQFVPNSLWKELSGKISGAEKDMYIRVLAEERTDLDALNSLEDEIARIIGADFETESENRLQEKLDNDEMIRGYELILGGFCVLFAVIGVAHVFSNTMGFVRQRKREFARYMSVGLTPEGIRKLFCVEAAVLTGRPVLITLLVTCLSVVLMADASHLDIMEFIRVAPVLPIAVFITAVFAFVALAYYLGARKLLKIPLAEALRDDTMV